MLRSLAWTLHHRHSRDDLSWNEIANHVEERLEAMGRTIDGLQVADWLHREAGVLADYGPGKYGFLHLGMQEYLAALHVATQGEELLGELCAACADEWWHEVLLLLVGMPGRRLFAPLMERLLELSPLADHEELLRACLAEAAEADLEPFLVRLDPKAPPERLQVILRLLRGRTESRLAARVTPLCAHTDLGVKALAQQMDDDLHRPPSLTEPACDLVVVHHPEDREAAAGLVSALSRAGWRVVVGDQDQLSQETARSTRAVALLAGPSGKPVWEDKDGDSTLKLLVRRRRPLIPVMLAGSPILPAIPEEFQARAWIELGPDLKDASTQLQVALAQATLGETKRPAQALRVEPGFAWTEALTGIRFLWIPGGGGRRQLGGRASFLPLARAAEWSGSDAAVGGAVGVRRARDRRARVPVGLGKASSDPCVFRPRLGDRSARFGRLVPGRQGAFRHVGPSRQCLGVVPRCVGREGVPTANEA